MQHVKRLLAAAIGATCCASGAHGVDASVAAGLGTTVRFATFNASLNRNVSGELLSDLANPGGSDFTTTVGRRIQQAKNVAEIIQRVNPSVLLVNEFDFDANGTPGASSLMSPFGYSSTAAARFQSNFLSLSQGNATRGFANPVNFTYRYTPNTNTGLASGFDLDNNGSIGGGNDAFGFGSFAGQFGMTIYSKHEIVNVRSFQTFKWKDMPGNLLTNDPSAAANNLANFYSAAERDALRLSSKNHVDVTLRINGQEVHFLTAHPTPPVFDGSEDRNGKRNFDEIRFWKDYVNGGANGSYIYDDAGTFGGLSKGAKFVIAGDYNADLCDGDSFKVACSGPNAPGIGPNAIGQLLLDPLVNNGMTPQSAGGTQAATDPNNNGTANASHLHDPKFDTADFNDAAPGNLRVDYVLASSGQSVIGSGVFWPVDGDQTDNNGTGALFDLVGQFNRPNLFSGLPSSDHRAVWIDVLVPVPEPEAYALMLSGLGLVGWIARRRRQIGK